MREAFTVGIIGGGPGGLMTAYRLQHRHRAAVDITLFEASPRLGGKILTQRMATTDARYEAGAAELYDYSDVGDDPLHELINELHLSTTAMAGRAVFLEGYCIRDGFDLGRYFGSDAQKAYEEFARRAREHVSPEQYYDSDEVTADEDPLLRQTFEDVLATVAHPDARRYIEVLIHSDVATEPRHTSATYGLHNFLMNEPGYMNLYALAGGIEELPKALAARLAIDVRLNTPVRSVEKTSADQYLLRGTTDGREWSATLDAVVIALPVYWIPAIDWLGEDLGRAMHAHHTHYDHPAHYLRVTLAFRRPFWRDVLGESYFMLDAFGGCCVYDESARQPDATVGVLGWLLAGEAAMAMSNLDDATLIARVLDSLPAELAGHANLLIEGRVHRWIGAVNAKPGGFPRKGFDERHQPDAVNHPLLFTVGDYLFDSTINGVLDSADCVAEWIAEESIDDDDVPTEANTVPQPAAL